MIHRNPGYGLRSRPDPDAGAGEAGSQLPSYPSASAEGYFSYIAESVVNAGFTEPKRNRQDAKISVAL